MEVVTATDILNGDFSFKWPIEDFNAYSKMLQYLIENKVVGEDDEYTYHEKLIIDPFGCIINPLCEPLDVEDFLNNPIPVECMVDDTNAIFRTFDDPRVLQVKFPFIRVTRNYTQTLSRKNRWKFNNECKKTGKIKISIAELDEDFEKLYAHRLASLNGEDDFLDVYCMLVFLRNTYLEKHTFKIFANDSLIGVSSLIRVDGAYYAIIFNSIQPCLYKFVEFLVEDYFDEGTVVHFGAANALGNFERFLYKKIISNDFLLTPYFCFSEEHAICPYYYIPERRWIVNEAE